MLALRLGQLMDGVLSSPLVIFVLALTARLKVLTDLLPVHAWNGYYRYNEPSHIAWALVSGFGYSAPWPNTPVAPTAQQPPIYPLLVAGIFKLTGTYTHLSLWIAVGFNAILSAVTAVLILRIGRRDFGRAAGVIAALAWSCWLYEAVVSVRLWESSLSCLLLMTGLLVLPRLGETRSLQPWLLFGALVGIAALTNTTLLSAFPFFWLWAWLSQRRRGRSCSRILLASVATCMLVLLPWTIRNYTAFHRLMPVRDNFGLELWVGLELGPGTPKATTSEFFTRDFPLSDPTEYNRMGESAFMESRMRMARQAIRQHPLRYAHLVVLRCFKYWSQPAGTPWLAISGLAWIGAILFVRRKRLDALPYVAVMICFPLVYYITHTFPTYRHVIEPVVLLMAAYAAATAIEALGKQIRRSNA
jgi:hypothetical protein